MNSECKGRIYKLLINSYVAANGSCNYRETLFPMKRKSCRGCDECGWLDDQLKDFMSTHYIFPEIKNPEHGKLYEPVYIPDPPDWETGISEGGEIIFIKISEKELE